MLQVSGTVTFIRDGIITIASLPSVFIEELVYFGRFGVDIKRTTNYVSGIVKNIDTDGTAKAMLFHGSEADLFIGMKVYRSRNSVTVHAGHHVVGQLLSPTCYVINFNEWCRNNSIVLSVINHNILPIEAESPGIVDRSPVRTPLHTGVYSLCYNAEQCVITFMFLHHSSFRIYTSSCKVKSINFITKRFYSKRTTLFDKSTSTALYSASCRFLNYVRALERNKASLKRSKVRRINSFFSLVSGISLEYSSINLSYLKLDRVYTNTELYEVELLLKLKGKASFLRFESERETVYVISSGFSVLELTHLFTGFTPNLFSIRMVEDLKSFFLSIKRKLISFSFVIFIIPKYKNNAALLKSGATLLGIPHSLDVNIVFLFRKLIDFGKATETFDMLINDDSAYKSTNRKLMRTFRTLDEELIKDFIPNIFSCVLEQHVISPQYTFILQQNLVERAMRSLLESNKYREWEEGVRNIVEEDLRSKKMSLSAYKSERLKIENLYSEKSTSINNSIYSDLRKDMLFSELSKEHLRELTKLEDKFHKWDDLEIEDYILEKTQIFYNILFECFLAAINQFSHSDDTILTVRSFAQDGKRCTEVKFSFEINSIIENHGFFDKSYLIVFDTFGGGNRERSANATYIKGVAVHGLKKNSHKVILSDDFVSLVKKLEKQRYTIDIATVYKMVHDWDTMSPLLSEETRDLELNTLLEIVEHFEFYSHTGLENSFTLKVHIDSRGRIYLGPTQLSPISSKIMRSIVSCSEVYTASKGTFYRYAMELYFGKKLYNKDLTKKKYIDSKPTTLDYIKDCLLEFKYLEADEPLLFFRCCIEAFSMHRKESLSGTSDSFDTSMFMYTDMRSSGSQILTLLTRNYQYIESLGLTSAYPQKDYYEQKAENLIGFLSSKHVDYLEHFLSDTNTNLRSFLKSPIMVMNYALTEYGLRAYFNPILDFYLKKESVADSFFSIDTFYNSIQLDSKLYSSLRHAAYYYNDIISKKQFGKKAPIHDPEDFINTVNKIFHVNRTSRCNSDRRKQVLSEFNSFIKVIYSFLSKEHDQLKIISKTLVQVANLKLEEVDTNDSTSNYYLNTSIDPSFHSSILYNNVVPVKVRVLNRTYKRVRKLKTSNLDKTQRSLTAHMIHQWDSFILRCVMYHMFSFNEPVIPIHDSFGIRLVAQPLLSEVLESYVEEFKGNNYMETKLVELINIKLCDPYLEYFQHPKHKAAKDLHSILYLSTPPDKEEINSVIKEICCNLKPKQQSLIGNLIYESLCIVKSWTDTPIENLHSEHIVFPTIRKR